MPVFYVRVCHYPLFNFIGLRIICNYFLSVSFMCQHSYALPVYALNSTFHVKMYSGNENLNIPRKSSNYPDARCIRVTGYQYLESKFIVPPSKLKRPLSVIAHKRISNKIIKMRNKKIKIEIEMRKYMYKKLS